MERLLTLYSEVQSTDVRWLWYGKHLVELKRELNTEVGYKGVQLVTISRPTAYGEYAPYHFADTEQEFQTLVKGLRP